MFVPINNIINTQNQPIFEAKFTNENPSDIYVQNKTAFIDLKNGILTIKETDGETKQYGLILPKDEKDLKIENLERKLQEMELRLNEHSEPTKPIGNFYTKEESERLSLENNYIYKEDAGRGYRRVVASPKPIDIVEKESISNLINDGNIVIAVGGGGIPVIYDNGVLTGVDAVIDKDLSSSLLARLIDFDILLILTNIDKVYLNYNKDNELGLDILCVDDALNYIKDNQFAKGSMLPKIEACINFVKATNKQAIITSLLSAKDALIGKTGTLIK